MLILIYIKSFNYVGIKMRNRTLVMSILSLLLVPDIDSKAITLSVTNTNPAPLATQSSGLEPVSPILEPQDNQLPSSEISPFSIEDFINGEFPSPEFSASRESSPEVEFDLDLDSEIDYQNTNWQELISSQNSITRALGIALMPEGRFLNQYFIQHRDEMEPPETLALLNNPNTPENIIRELINSRSAEDAIRDTKYEVRYEMSELVALARELPEGEMRKALAKAFYLQGKTKERILRFTLPQFLSPFQKEETREILGSLYYVMELNSASSGKRMDLEEEWLAQKLPALLKLAQDTTQDVFVRGSSLELLIYGVRRLGVNKVFLDTLPLPEVAQKVLEITKTTDEYYIGYTGWELLGEIMRNKNHMDMFAKIDLARDILNWIQQGLEDELINYWDLSGAGYVLMWAIQEEFLPLEDKLSIFSFIQENLPSSMASQFSLLNLIMDSNIPLNKKMELSQPALEWLRNLKDSQELRMSNSKNANNLTLLAMLSAQSQEFKDEVTDILESKELLSDKSKEIWERYSVFVLDGRRSFSQRELEIISQILEMTPEHFRKSIGLIYSQPQGEDMLTATGKISTILGFARFAGGIDILGGLTEWVQKWSDREMNKWFSRVIIHESAHNYHFFQMNSVERILAQLDFDLLDSSSNSSDVPREYARTNIFEYLASMVEFYYLDSANLIAQAKNNFYLYLGVRLVVEILKSEKDQEELVPIYRIDEAGNLRSRMVEIGEDGLPIIPPDF